jgi:hypothetical protein
LVAQSTGQDVTVSPVSHVPLPQEGLTWMVVAAEQSLGQLAAVSPVSQTVSPQAVALVVARQSAGQVASLSPVPGWQ